MTDSRKNLDSLVNLYLQQKGNVERRKGNLELEIRFGTRGYNRINHIQYDNVIKYLISIGFIRSSTEHYLRVFSEFLDNKTGINKISKIRYEIGGLGKISQYCKNDSIDDSIIGKFEQKLIYHHENITNPVDIEDFNFRASLQEERIMSPNSDIVRSLVQKWNDTKKIFRYISRCSLTNEKFPFKVDVSVVKTSKAGYKGLIPSYRFKDSGLLESNQQYEIEIEFDNNKISSEMYNPADLVKSLKILIKYVLSGIQSSPYPIPFSQQSDIKKQYKELIFGKDKDKDKDRGKKENIRLYPKNFIGPSSYTLQIVNTSPINDNTYIPNIRNNYTVTEKADGDRKLLFITDNGYIYLIDTNMNIQFTGARSQNKDLFNTIIDGEHILHNKNKMYINLFAAFDIYFLNKKDLRTLPFSPQPKDETIEKNSFRLPVLVNVIKNLKPVSTTTGGIPSIRIENKIFYSSSDGETIFQSCNFILQKVTDNLFEYNTDGLIFTPRDLGVGMNKVDETDIKNYKTTWDYSFKWKPPEFNTIDFLLSIKKNPDGQDFIGNIFQSGTNTSNSTQLTQYKTVILKIGFDEKKHGYINPCNDVYNDNLPSYQDKDDYETYKPMQFFPSNPSDDSAGITNILLQNINSSKELLTEENEVIEDNTIVECRYIPDNENGWKWSPIRVRYDKTADLKGGGRNFGNAYHVANSNWESIHFPVTKEMITTGLGIPNELADDDVYYNRGSGNSMTRGLRDFHNLFVKKILISAVSRREDILIDLAVGKGGDISKWIYSKLKFVFGIDISKDNIENRIDGACARYLNYRKKFKYVPRCLFINGNSSVNIRNGDASFTEKSKQITKAIFGQGNKDKLLGEGIYKAFGIANEGFNICSIQFAIHYMFENPTTFNQFLRNVSETTKVGGYFIGTSYDGKAIFDLLNSKKINESISINENEKKIWELTKKYDRNTFEDDSSSLGYAIDVYQDSINKTFREYLVNYNYLTRIMENYGFTLLSREEAMEKGLPNGSAPFSDLFGIMKNDIAKNKKLANEYGNAPSMSSSEKKISFLNKFFVYKKIRNIDANTIAQSLSDETKAEQSMDLDASIEATVEIKKNIPKVKGKKLKKKLVLM